MQKNSNKSNLKSNKRSFNKTNNYKKTNNNSSNKNKIKILLISNRAYEYN